MKASFYSHGKLLISGEYAVLDGGLSLAVPTKPGQSLALSPLEDPLLLWTSLDEKGNPWFETEIPLAAISRAPYRAKQPETVRHRLLKILHEAWKLNGAFLSGNQGLSVTTSLEFPRDWGLGSSSTLINNIAQWAGINAYELHGRSFAGSGYDIACAQHRLPILFQLRQGLPVVREIPFDPPFKESLFFVHLNRKQDSREGIGNYRKTKVPLKTFVQESSSLTQQFVGAGSLSEFKEVMDAHERLVSKVLGMPRISDSLFGDYPGSIKSLGAWGGDFVLATGAGDEKAYFIQKGYDTIIPYTRMVL